MVNDALKSLYRQIPTFQCRKGCTDCCGPVPFSEAEADQIEIKRKAKPGSIDCPYSKGGRCEIYDKRPFMCRLFGASHEKALKCPHGCGPLFPLTSEATKELTWKYISIMEGEKRYGKRKGKIQKS